MMATSSTETQRGFNPRDELVRLLRDLLRISPVFFYFFLYWRPKEFLRTWLRVGALGFLSFSLFALWFETAAELLHLTAFIALVPDTPKWRWSMLVLLTVSVMLLLWHHHQERRQRHTEYLLGERVWEFMATRGVRSRDDTIALALRLFYEVFEPYGIGHTSIALLRDDMLQIDNHHVFPKEDSEAFFHPLPLGNSVAGYVFDDLQPRYVPRLFFPWNDRKQRPFCISFPHAMPFEIRKTDQGHLDVVQPKIDMNAFNNSGSGEFAFASFVTVPLKPRDRGRPLGVLNFDFETTDPLNRVDLKIAVLLGLILADEIDRLEPH